MAVITAAVACAPDHESRRSGPLQAKSGDVQEENLFLSLPIAPVETFNTIPWSFEAHNQNIPPSDPNVWLGLDESQVFQKRLTHIQKDNDWTIKVGKGGQIYSISTPQTGEMVAIQRKTSGQWVDEVFQHVVPSHLFQKDKGPTSTVVDADIHQAGYYTQSDNDWDVQIIPESVYSPTFPPTHIDFLQAKNSFSLTTWPQHAHLPRTYSENGLLMQQMLRDLGDGVIEVTLLINKWQGVETRSINLPWSAWRPQNLPSVLISQPDGSYAESNQEFGASPVRKLLKPGSPAWSPDTGGWIAVAQSSSSSSRGIGIVFGKTASAIEGDASYLRWGNYAKPAADPTKEPVLGPHEGTVVTVKRNVVLLPGDTVFARYFMVIGPVSKIQYYGNLLQSRVELGRISTDERQAGLICISQDAAKKLRRGCPEGVAPLFSTYRDFQTNSQPLFLLERQDGTSILSNNAYEISSDPTDRQTKSYNFLGWALPVANVATFRYGKLADVPPVSGLSISSSAQGLYVRDPAVKAPLPLSSDTSLKNVTSSDGQSYDLSVSPITIMLKAAPINISMTAHERASLALMRGSVTLKTAVGTLSFASDEWPDMSALTLSVTAEDGSKASYYLKLVTSSSDKSLKSITTSLGQNINVAANPISIQLKAAPATVSVVVHERARIALLRGSSVLRTGTGSLSFVTNEWPDMSVLTLSVTAEDGSKASYELRLLPPSTDNSLKSISTSIAQNINIGVSPISIQLKAAPMTVSVAVHARARLALLRGSSVLRTGTGGLSFTTNEWPDMSALTLRVTAEDGSFASYSLRLLPASTDVSIKSISTSLGQSLDPNVSPFRIQLTQTPLRVTITAFERAKVELFKLGTTFRTETGSLSFYTNEWPDVLDYWIFITAEDGTKAQYVLRLLPPK